MAAPKFKRLHVEKQVSAHGWTKWVQPKMDKYMLGCCDCGLVHELQFRIVGVRKKVVQYRARRAVAYTRHERKRKGIRLRTVEDKG